jgi:hypothetical protein
LQKYTFLLDSAKIEAENRKKFQRWKGEMPSTRLTRILATEKRNEKNLHSPPDAAKLPLNTLWAV